jgi:hypothetical protein
MKIFSYSQFKQYGYVIPNLDESKFRISRTGKITKIIHVPSDQVLARYADDWPSVQYVNVIKLKQLNLFSLTPEYEQHDQYSGENLLDDLYYMYNPPKFLKANGSPYYDAISKFTTRVRDHDQLASLTTLNLITQYVEYIENIVNVTNPTLENGSVEKIREFNKLISPDLTVYIGKCRFTNTLLTRHSLILRRFSDTPESIRRGEPVSRTVVVEDLGYHMEVMTIPGVGRAQIWLKQFEMVVENHIIDYRHTELRTCSCCSRSLPTRLFTADATTCNVCEANKYQIYSYSTKAEQLLSFKAKKVTKDTLYLGCELEYETTDRDKARIAVGRALEGHAIMKSDGSIHNGFEIVTCPATLDIQLDVFSKFFENYPAELQSASNVGMHIHISRKPLSVLTVGKLTRFMNHPDNKAFIESIAGRANNSYCRQDISRSEHLSYPLVNKGGGERYNVLNVRNENTIEFRIFSTPTSYDDFASKLQFVQALVEYSKPCAVALSAYAHKSYEEFTTWLSKNKRTYPNLCKKLGLIKTQQQPSVLA